VGSTVIKQIDHYDVEPTKLVMIDLENHKIGRTVDFPKDESLVGFWRIQMKFSPDGKYFYMFLGNILVFDSKTLELVKKIDLADPHVPGVSNVIFNPVEEEPAEDPNEEPGKLTNVFMSSDSYVHRNVFGIAKIDLAKVSFDFTPIAPATTLSMTPLLLTPDHQTGYTVVIDGSPGNRRCEFWAFDMKNRKLINKKEFQGRNRFSFALSADGTKIFIYGAGYEISVYDAKTFEFRNNVVLPGDMTSNIIVMPLSAASAASSASAVPPPGPVTTMKQIRLTASRAEVSMSGKPLMPTLQNFAWTVCLCLAIAESPGRVAGAAEQLAYFGTWPHQVVVFDAAQEKIVGTIDLKSDVPRTLLLSPDKKKLYVSTLNDNSILTIDLATRAVTFSFSLNSGNSIVRLIGLAPDPSGKYLYGLATFVYKQRDHYDIDPPKFIVIDLAAQKIVRTGECPKEEGPFGFRSAIKLSPDGRLLYLFRHNILVFDTSSFHLVKKVDLAKPQVPGIENVSLGVLDDPNDLPGKVTSVFSSSDPYVHRKVFGIGVIDLSNLSFEFSPVAPADAGDILSLFLTPDRKTGYTVAINGDPGNHRCEFWAFDMWTRKRIRRHEFDGRTRFSFGVSGDGAKLFIYGAGYQIEVYDARTFVLRSNVEVPGDITTNMVVLPVTSAAASAADQNLWSPGR
jgi:WD40 repeat protein